MQEHSTDPYRFPQEEAARDTLTELLHEGARRMLAEAVEAEVEQYLAERSHLTDAEGRQQVVRNGHLPQRELQTPVGSMAVQQPRVRDRRPPEQREKFTPQVLPPYLRRTRSLEELIPWLYLKGISTGDFGEALRSLLGENAPGLSPTTIGRLKSGWEQEYKDWCRRDLSSQRYVYLWADGIYFNIRLEDPGNDRQCILVLMGATAEGKKELLAVADGYRESEQSWKELLLDVQHRGLTEAPKLAVGDGALGFWAALAKVYPTTRWQRCWVHKVANVLNKMPKSVQGKAKAQLNEIRMAETRQAANEQFDLFIETYEAKHLNAVECLRKDREELLAFYDFPAEHWVHLRTTNPIESTFATVRLRTRKTKGSGSRVACLTMVFKLTMAAQQRWRALNGSKLIPEVIRNVQFVDGIKTPAA